jgi:hypothetical protein
VLGIEAGTLCVRFSRSTPSACARGPFQHFNNLLAANERNFGALREIDKGGFLEQEGPTGFNCYGTHFCFPRNPQGFGADNGTSNRMS